jgi:hypothetical protein
MSGQLRELRKVSLAVYHRERERTRKSHPYIPTDMMELCDEGLRDAKILRDTTAMLVEEEERRLSEEVRERGT